MMMENTPSSVSETSNMSHLREKAEQVKSRMAEKTQSTLQVTSKTMDNVMSYIKEHDTQAMVDDLQVVIRKHPGKSVVAGLLLGLLIGRVARRM